MSFKEKIDKIVQKNGLPYLEVLVFKGYQEKLSFKHNATGKERLQMYSMSKIFTVVSALQLIEQGKLCLSDKVEKFFPCFEKTYYKNGKKIVPNPTPITIKHLLTMTSGLSYEIHTPFIKEVKEKMGESGKMKDFIPAFIKSPLLFEPGKDFKYSLSHDVLAGVVEVVAGKSFDEYVEENIFKPLEMQSATFKNYQGEIFEKYVCRKDLTVVPTSLDNELLLSNNYISGGAGLVSSIKDYSKLVKALTNNGVAENGAVILKKETIDMMVDSPLPNEFVGQNLSWLTNEYGYGLGVRVREKENEYGVKKGEFGWDGACGSFWLADRESEVSVVIGMNVLSWELKYLGIHNEIVNVVYQHIKEK